MTHLCDPDIGHDKTGANMFYHWFEWQDWASMEGADTSYVFENFANPDPVNALTMLILEICSERFWRHQR